MAPIKFEENIKEKLEQRTLSPSSESWSKLSERLDAEENKSKKPIFWWLSIAAGLLIMIAISTQFFSANESETVLPQVVKENVINEQLNNKQLEPIQKEAIEIVNEDDSIEAIKETLPTVKDSKIIDHKKVIQKKAEPKTQLANQSQPVEESVNLNQQEQLHNEAHRLLEDAKLKIAVAEAVETINSDEIAVSDKEIDSLLKLASKELFKDNLKNETLIAVDANALLMSVEDEMGQSFRSRVFEALKESYKTVKTAVADRNN
ncbi:hypothetical protein [Winogradskyella helgolandensis]|uniref:hypothetical protein n=1 Tax=Winogradskyella helgolandensis TaxID=2697010 RepID=UPI0015B8670F|nr:hypothetical protein [Winogradskyella helgolandensis]